MRAFVSDGLREVNARRGGVSQFLNGGGKRHLVPKEPLILHRQPIKSSVHGKCNFIDHSRNQFSKIRFRCPK